MLTFNLNLYIFLAFCDVLSDVRRNTREQEQAISLLGFWETCPETVPSRVNAHNSKYVR